MTSSRGLWIGVALGGPLIALAVVDALSSSSATRPRELVLWLLGLVLVTDLLVLPVALAAGRLVGGRPWLRWVLSCAAVVALVAWPFVRGYGGSSGNPSLLPRDYGGGTLVAIGCVTAVATMGALVTRRAHGRR